MIKIHIHNQWSEEDSISIFCVDVAIEKEFLVFLVGFLGVLVWVGFGLGEPEEDEDTYPPAIL